MACIHFHQEETNADRVRELSRSQNARSHMGAVQAEEKGRDLEMALFPRDVVIVGEEG